ncbi:hypothetical protein HOD29_04950 [archaeon]|jgi:hypothetical protein|nr:hypothetical protein [archaeon]
MKKYYYCITVSFFFKLQYFETFEGEIELMNGDYPREINKNLRKAVAEQVREYYGSTHDWNQINIIYKELVELKNNES